MRILSYLLVFWAILLLCPPSVSAQTSVVTVSGVVNDPKTSTALPYVTVILKTEQDTTFVTGTLTDGDGRFTLSSIKPGNYRLEFSLIGYTPKKQSLFVGSLTSFLDVGTIGIDRRRDNAERDRRHGSGG